MFDKEKKLLIVDDEANVLSSLKRLLADQEYTTYTATTASDAFKLLKKHDFGVVISDQQMTEMTGIELLAKIKKLYPNIIRIVLSGYADYEDLLNAINTGEIYRFIAKPWDNKQVFKIIGLAFEQRKLLLTNKLLSQVCANSIEGMLLVTKDNVAAWTNTAMCQMIGLDINVIIGNEVGFIKPNNELETIPDLEYKSNSIFMVDEINKTGSWRGLCWLIHKNSRKVPIMMTVTKMDDINFNDQHYIYICLDITDEYQYRECMEHYAYHDNLTSLPNRLLFSDRVSTALSQAKRNNYSIAVFYMDLDGFKAVNDGLGHHAGDQLLQDVTSRLLDLVREEDTVARLGGDEFAILLPNITEDKIGLENLATRILGNIDQPFTVEKHEVNIGVSIGIATYPESGETEVEILQGADAAMYQTKAAGKNNFSFYKKEMNYASSDNLSLSNDMRAAIQNEDFYLDYLPKLNIKGDVLGAEVLLRWKHPKLGIIMPEGFIPIAEKSGMIVPIGDWILRQACKDIKQWYELGFSDLKVSVNISAEQLIKHDLVSVLECAIFYAGIPTTALELEIKESILIKGIEQKAKALQAIVKMGVILVLDNFGIGFSSLTDIKKYHFNTLKIDRSFISDMLLNGNKNEFICTIISIGKIMNMNIIAEGVETEDQLKKLQELGCTEFQGYFYSKPLSMEDFTNFMLARKNNGEAKDS